MNYLDQVGQAWWGVDLIRRVLSLSADALNNTFWESRAHAWLASLLLLLEDPKVVLWYHAFLLGYN